MSGTTDEAFFESEVERLRKLALEQGQRVGESERERLRELHWLRCAKCGMQMETVMYAGLQMERCFHCGGTYMDQAELEKVARESSQLIHGLVARLQGPEARTESGQWSLGDGRTDTPRTLSDGFGDFSDASLLPSQAERERDPGGWAGVALVALLFLVGVLYLVLFQRSSVDRVLGGQPQLTVTHVAKPIIMPKSVAAVAPEATQPSPTEVAKALPEAVPPPPTEPAVAPEAPKPPPTATATPTPPPQAEDAAKNPTPKAPPAATAATPAATPPAPAAPAAGDAKTGPPKAVSYDRLLANGRKELMRGQASKAMRLYEAANKKKPGSVEALTGMGWAYVNLREPHVGVVKFKQALSRNSRYGDAYIGLGKAYRMMGKTADARRAYQRYLELHPRGPSAGIAKNAIASLAP